MISLVRREEARCLLRVLEAAIARGNAQRQGWVAGRDVSKLFSRFAMDSPLEETGLELFVPREEGLTSSRFSTFPAPSFQEGPAVRIHLPPAESRDEPSRPPAVSEIEDGARNSRSGRARCFVVEKLLAYVISCYHDPERARVGVDESISRLRAERPLPRCAAALGYPRRSARRTLLP
jgi:hypothetical protein